MNVRRPGFQLLSLAPAQLRHEDVPTYKDVPCLLPDQLRIYLIIYLPLLVVSIIFICLANIVNCSSSGWGSPSREKILSMQYATPSSYLPSIRYQDQDGGINHKDSEELGLDYTSAPTSPITTAHQVGRSLRTWRIFTHQNRRLHPSFIRNWNCLKCRACFFRSGRRRRRGWLSVTIRDIRDIAPFPLGVFVIITWWMIAT